VDTVACRRLGEIAGALGAGRSRAADIIDPAVGLEVHVRIGDAVTEGRTSDGRPAVRIHARDEAAADAAAHALADAIRTGWGSGVRCNSAYRPVEYNRLVGSQDTSQHVAFRAMDLSPVHGSLSKFYSVARAAVEAYRKTGKIVGFGIYNTFIHIDVGGRKANADWDMRR
jgi:hypothetical protein